MAGGAGGGRGGTRAPLVSVSSRRRAVSSPPLPARRRRRPLPRRAPLGRAGRRWRNKAQRLRRGHQYGGHAGAPRSAAPRGAESGAGGYSATCRAAPAPQKLCRKGHAPLCLSAGLRPERYGRAREGERYGGCVELICCTPRMLVRGRAATRKGATGRRRARNRSQKTTQVVTEDYYSRRAKPEKQSCVYNLVRQHCSSPVRRGVAILLPGVYFPLNSHQQPCHAAAVPGRKASCRTYLSPGADPVTSAQAGVTDAPSAGISPELYAVL